MNWKKLRKQNLGVIPQEASQNLQAPEVAPARSTSKINIRTKPLNFKVSEEFYWQLKELALKEKRLMVEVVERSLECYKRHCSEVNSSQSNGDKELEKYVKVIEDKPKPQKKLIPYSYINFTCDKCGNEYEQDVAYSYAPSLKELSKYQTYCGGCVE